MNLLLTYFRSQILQILTWVLLLLWAISASIFAIKKKDQIIFVKMKNDEVSILKDLSKEDESYLEKIFLKRFIQLHYTFDNQSFESQIAESAQYLDQNLIKNLQNDVAKTKLVLNTKNITRTAVIEQITKKDNQYHVILNVLSLSNEIKDENQNEITQGKLNINILRQKYLVRVMLEKVPRSLSNPFGLIVTNLDDQEKIL